MKKERKTVLKKLCDLRELNFLLLSTNSVKSKVISDIYIFPLGKTPLTIHKIHPPERHK